MTEHPPQKKRVISLDQDFDLATIYGDNFTLRIEGDTLFLNTDESTINITIDPANGSTSIQIREPAAEQDNEPTETAAPTQKAFELGHVFTAEELPEDKQHLAGALYYANDPADGSMLIVSAEQFPDQFGGLCTWDQLQDLVNNLNTHGNETRIGTTDDWDNLEESGFLAKNFNPHKKSILHRRYWKADLDEARQSTLDPEITGAFSYYEDKIDGWEWTHTSELKDTYIRGVFFTNLDPAELSM